jgi:hypothetical protein
MKILTALGFDFLPFTELEGAGILREKHEGGADVPYEKKVQIDSHLAMMEKLIEQIRRIMNE